MFNLHSRELAYRLATGSQQKKAGQSAYNFLSIHSECCKIHNDEGVYFTPNPMNVHVTILPLHASGNLLLCCFSAYIVFDSPSEFYLRFTETTCVLE